jgi:hypothetical protein
VTWSGTGIGSYRYGSCALWTLDSDLAGSGAGRFVDRVDLFFRAGESSLLVDLRQAGLVDSLGAAALARCRDTHAGMRVVGRPPTWDDLPLAVRCTLLGLDAAPDLETALASSSTRTALALAPAERRLHPRFPLQLPVELFFAGKRAPAALSDISRGGVNLSLIPGSWLAALPAGEGFDILGLAADPLGREITARFAAEPVPVAAVRTATAAALGARFTDSHPPV